MDEKLLAELFYEGFLPGPNESEEDFLKRVELSRELALNPQKAGLKDVEVGKKIGPFNLSWLLHKVSNKKLPIWEGAATWIIDCEGAKIPFLQFRKAHAQSEEIWDHELVHILRIAFDEPRFEEILAFDRSKSRFRKWLGPLLRTPKESIFFVVASFAAIGLSLLWPQALFFPFLLLLGFGLRLARDYRIFSRFKKVISSQNLLYLFSDSEIERVANGEDPKEVLQDLRKKIFVLK